MQANTLRQEIIRLLSEGEMDVRELSQALSISEKEVYPHLEHAERTVAAQGGRLSISPCRCLSCGYVFKDRKRFTRPSRCPQCKRSHLQPPSYGIFNGK